MSRIRLYLDENIQVALADALRARGVDVLTTFKAGNVGLSDFINFSSQLNQKERFLPIIKEILQSSIMLNGRKSRTRWHYFIRPVSSRNYSS